MAENTENSFDRAREVLEEVHQATGAMTEVEEPAVTIDRIKPARLVSEDRAELAAQRKRIERAAAEVDAQKSVDNSVSSLKNSARNERLEGERKKTFAQRAAMGLGAFTIAASGLLGIKGNRVEKPELTDKAAGGHELVDKNAEMLRAEDARYRVEAGDSVEGIFNHFYKSEGYRLATFEQELIHRNPGRFAEKDGGIEDPGLREGEIINLPSVSRLTKGSAE